MVLGVRGRCLKLDMSVLAHRIAGAATSTLESVVSGADSSSPSSEYNVTTEDDFQCALDANPDDWQTRLVFADWLDEKGDARGPGYRALGQIKLRPALGHVWDGATSRFSIDTVYSWYGVETGRPAGGTLKMIWFSRIEGAPVRVEGCSKLEKRGWSTRREAEDAAALAFSLVPNNLKHRCFA